MEASQPNPSPEQQSDPLYHEASYLVGKMSRGTLRVGLTTLRMLAEYPALTPMVTRARGPSQPSSSDPEQQTEFLRQEAAYLTSQMPRRRLEIFIITLRKLAKYPAHIPSTLLGVVHRLPRGESPPS